MSYIRRTEVPRSNTDNQMLSVLCAIQISSKKENNNNYENRTHGKWKHLKWYCIYGINFECDALNWTMNMNQNGSSSQNEWCTGTELNEFLVECKCLWCFQTHFVYILNKSIHFLCCKWMALHRNKYLNDSYASCFVLHVAVINALEWE